MPTLEMTALSFRACKTRRRQLDNPQKNTLDGDLLWRYFDLSFIERNELLSRLGMTSDQVDQAHPLVRHDTRRFASF